MAKTNLNLLQCFSKFVLVRDLEDCWLWQGSKTGWGHGQIKYNGRMEEPGFQVTYTKEEQVLQKAIAELMACGATFLASQLNNLLKETILERLRNERQ